MRSTYYLGMTFINREWIALLESRFHFQIEFCNVPMVTLFQVRNADWFIIDIWQMFTLQLQPDLSVSFLNGLYRWMKAQVIPLGILFGS